MLSHPLQGGGDAGPLHADVPADGRGAASTTRHPTGPSGGSDSAGTGRAPGGGGDHDGAIDAGLPHPPSQSAERRYCLWSSWRCLNSSPMRGGQRRQHGRDAAAPRTLVGAPCWTSHYGRSASQHMPPSWQRPTLQNPATSGPTYMRTVVNASRNYEGSAWAAFDAAYHRWAASRRSLNWSVFDASLYGQAFTGRSRSIPRCQFCMEDSHLSRACPFAPVEDGATRRGSMAGQGLSAPGLAAETCCLFNRGLFRFRMCKYAHVCARCRRGHPATECPRAEGHRRVRSRSPSPRPWGPPR